MTNNYKLVLYIAERYETGGAILMKPYYKWDGLMRLWQLEELGYLTWAPQRPFPVYTRKWNEILTANGVLKELRVEVMIDGLNCFYFPSVLSGRVFGDWTWRSDNGE